MSEPTDAASRASADAPLDPDLEIGRLLHVSGVVTPDMLTGFEEASRETLLTEFFERHKHHRPVVLKGNTLLRPLAAESDTQKTPVHGPPLRDASPTPAVGARAPGRSGWAPAGAGETARSRPATTDPIVPRAGGVRACGGRPQPPLRAPAAGTAVSAGRSKAAGAFAVAGLGLLVPYAWMIAGVIAAKLAAAALRQAERLGDERTMRHGRIAFWVGVIEAALGGMFWVAVAIFILTDWVGR